jgi:spore germination cell wall hydrolase CwlJ-like protein
MLTSAALCLALNIFFEARDEPFLGQLMVAEVTLNRVEHRSYPDNICDVVWQRRQFSWTHDGLSDNPEDYPYLDREAWGEILVLTTRILNGEQELPNNEAIMFHADYVLPYWVDHYEQVGMVGGHIFYGERGE